MDSKSFNRVTLQDASKFDWAEFYESMIASLLKVKLTECAKFWVDVHVMLLLWESLAPPRPSERSWEIS